MQEGYQGHWLLESLLALLGHNELIVFLWEIIADC